MEYRLVTLLLMRLKNIDAWSAELPQGVVDDRLSSVRKIFEEEVAKRHGLIQADPLGRYPESYLASFPGPSDAIATAAELMKLFQGGRPSLPAGSVEAGCAINTGEIAERNGQLIGRPLEIVSRLEYRAEASQVLFTESVLLSVGELALPYDALLRKIGAETGPSMRAFSLNWAGGEDGES